MLGAPRPPAGLGAWQTLNEGAGDVLKCAMTTRLSGEPASPHLSQTVSTRLVKNAWQQRKLSHRGLAAKDKQERKNKAGKKRPRPFFLLKNNMNQQLGYI